MAYDANLNNELGFEWILFKHASGHSLLNRWHEMSWLKKELIVRKIMDYMVQLSRIELSGIGSMFRYSLSSGNSEGFHHKIGEYVAAYFFRNEHIQLEIPRGPYTTSSEWLAAHMEIISHNITMWHESGGDDRGLAVEAQKIFEDLQRVLLKFFPSFDPEPTFLDQHRFDEYSILVDDSGDLVCILDWSSINAVPRWEAYQIPRFLYSTCVKYIPEPPTEEDKQDEEFYEEYKYKIQNYETWRLRTFFLEKMQRIAPEWVRTFKKETTKRDILMAIECLDHSLHTMRVQRWLNCVLEDRIPQKSLTDAVSFPWLRDYADDMPCQRHVKVEDPDEEAT
ncbi:hypothetical protein C7974DRAFT_443519 [Boeremia exigua]|uniref:uncharacterized protein n=1 Tax=Boeremia exigua TaxID=749465 RepID=UPI001E8D623A|nr:uncharacterized protein C7974DRAFT_443519 [Boeremia exigua]KAH6615304.1 hypothetical protein C7974DRAFT_443519 [Boeremia exigua]